jgi:branched-chain amino acid transport system ATP-binding protein
MNALEVRKLHVAYGSLTAVRDMSLTVGHGEAVALVGANGAGKSSILSAISGIVRSSGEVFVRGVQTGDRNPRSMLAAGLAHVVEGHRVFPQISVRDHLRVACPGGRSRSFTERVDRVLTLLPDLREKLGRSGSELSGGQRQQLVIACGLMSNPTILLLDEPSLGLDPRNIDRVVTVIRELVSNGLSVVVAEQNLRYATAMTDRVYVVADGSAHGDYASDSPDLVTAAMSAYLGAGHAEPTAG